MKQAQCLLGSKSVRVDNRMGRLRERESRPRGGLAHLSGAFLPGSLWAVPLLHLVLSPCLAVSASSRVLLSEPRWILARRRVGTLASLTVRQYPRSFDLQGAFLCMRS